MSTKREHLDVGVDGDTLRAGAKAYPLHTVTRAITTEHAPDRGAAVRRYAVTVALGLIPAAVVSALSPDLVSALVTTTALTWFTARTIRLAKAMNRTRYELAVDTTTGRHRILTTDNPHTAAAIAFEITDALTGLPADPSHEDPPNRINQA
ncbi:DUF6232 family protein [Actinophytocola glycyrrhizae]|uniref:DUF6232 family protein n=1 Tax=Actinophytocola glycyrrhizae TaxID=2044873 RepID=A0ABV9RX76_9PSEU